MIIFQDPIAFTSFGSGPLAGFGSGSPGEDTAPFGIESQIVGGGVQIFTELPVLDVEVVATGHRLQDPVSLILVWPRAHRSDLFPGEDVAPFSVFGELADRRVQELVEKGGLHGEASVGDFLHQPVALAFPVTGVICRFPPSEHATSVGVEREILPLGSVQILSELDVLDVN